MGGCNALTADPQNHGMQTTSLKAGLASCECKSDASSGTPGDGPNPLPASVANAVDEGCEGRDLTQEGFAGVGPNSLRAASAEPRAMEITTRRVCGIKCCLAEGQAMSSENCTAVNDLEDGSVAYAAGPVLPFRDGECMGKRYI